MAASISLHDLRVKLNREVSVQRLAEGQGVALERDGAGYRAVCPFHADPEKRLTIRPKENSWQCDGGCAGGSAVEWVMAAKHLLQDEAVAWLRAEFMGPGTGPGDRDEEGTPALAPLDPALDDQGLLAEVLAHYQNALLTSPEAQRYLAGRGLSNPDLIPHLRLGYADRSLGYRIPGKQWKAGKKIRSQLQRLGVLRSSGHETLRGSLVVPLLDATGEIVDAYGRKIGRRLRKGTPLHTSLHDPWAGIWNVAALASYAEILVAKSLMDGLTWWNWGFRNVVAGTPSALVAEITAQSIDRLVLAFDRNDAGRKTEDQLVQGLAGAGVEIFAARFPGDYDANRFACETDAPQDALAEIVRAAEWVGTGTASVPVSAGKEIARVPFVGDEPEPSASTSVAPEPTETEEPAAAVPFTEEPIVPAPPTMEPPASAVPDPPPPEPDLEAAEHEIRVRFGGRHWRVRGLARNTTYDRLRVNLMVRREEAAADPRLAGYHLDTLDLYSAKHRAAFARVAALEIAVAEPVVNRDLGHLLLRLEQLQDEAIQAALEPKEPAVPIPPEEHAQAMELLESPELLERIVADFARCGVVGEETSKLVGYLAAVSRKLADPLALLIQSSSAAGKTTLLEAILAFVPEEDRLSFSSITGQAAYYFADGDLRHKTLAIAEEQGASRASYALKLLQSEGRLAIASTGKDATTGRLTSQEYVVEGPVALMLSTTRIDVDPELENRAIVLEVSESRALTRAIHEKQRESDTLAGMLAREDRDRILHLHHNAQRLLRPVNVVNPYADQLGFPDTTTRARRDHRKYLGLIRAVAFLHQHQRERKKATHGVRRVEYIEVRREDIAVANRLAHAVLGRSLASVPPQTRRLLGLLAEMVDEIARSQGVARAEVRFTRRGVREHTGWGHSQLAAHLKRLEDLEYLLCHAGGPGRRRIYELCYAGDHGGDEPRLPGLVDAEALVEPSAYGSHHPGPGEALPARFRGTSGSLPARVRTETPTGTDGAGS